MKIRFDLKETSSRAVADEPVSRCHSLKLISPPLRLSDSVTIYG